MHASRNGLTAVIREQAARGRTPYEIEYLTYSPRRLIDRIMLAEHITVKPYDHLADEIERCAAAGMTRSGIAAKTGKSHSFICDKINQRKLAVPRARRYTKKPEEAACRPEIDRLLTGEYSLAQIAGMIPSPRSDTGHLTRAGVWEYLDKRHKRGEFLKNRADYTQRLREKAERAKKMEQDKKEAERRACGPLAGALRAYLHKKAAEKGWIWPRAVEFILNRRPHLRNTPPEKVTKLLELYKGDLDSGTPAGIERLAKYSEIASAMTTKRLLLAVGLDPMYGYRRLYLTPEIKNAIENLYETDIPIKDIAHFLDVPHYTVQCHMKKRFGGTGERRRWIKTFGHGKNRDFLNHRTASEIYYVDDAAPGVGWGDEEIMTYFGGKREMVEYARAKRRRIEKEIMQILGAKSPGKYTKPYRMPEAA